MGGLATVGTAGDILNRVAVEIGMNPVADPYSSNDPLFIQMRTLLNVAGEEMIQAYPWELMVKEAQITTLSTDSGDYPLPNDFLYMINQTGWERSQNVPLFGPLSPQDWQYLLGRDLVTSTIYASFRLQEGLLRLFPQPPPDGLDIHYEYISKNWVLDPLTSSYRDSVNQPTDQPLYDKTLISRALKVKILEAKGWDSTKAQADLNQTFSFLTSQDKGAQVLRAGSRGGGVPYLNIWRNLPDTNYGY